MLFKPTELPYCWYIFPGALVRWKLPEWRDRCALIIGPSGHFHDELNCLAPVVSIPSDRYVRIDGIDFKLAAEAHRIEAQFQLRHYNPNFKRSIQVPHLDML